MSTHFLPVRIDWSTDKFVEDIAKIVILHGMPMSIIFNSDY